VNTFLLARLKNDVHITNVTNQYIKMNTTTTPPQASTAATDNTSVQTPQTNNKPSPIKPAFDPQYAIYKPNNRGTGGVVRLGLSQAKSCVFLEAANQSGERQFDWESKIIMKWGLPDLGSVLALLQGRSTEAKLFHRTEKADTSMLFNRQTEQDRAPYLLSITRKLTADGSAQKTTIPVTHSEAAILQTILTSAITRILEW